jgi:hypothetical protein
LLVGAVAETVFHKVLVEVEQVAILRHLVLLLTMSLIKPSLLLPQQLLELLLEQAAQVEQVILDLVGQIVLYLVLLQQVVEMVVILGQPMLMNLVKQEGLEEAEGVLMMAQLTTLRQEAELLGKDLVAEQGHKQVA